jgi:hypothetical protein
VQGYDLVAQIFVREINDDLIGLVRKLDKQIDETARKHKRSDRFGVFVIFLGDDADTRKKLKELAVKQGLKHVVLTSTNATGETRNKLAREADVTVAVYSGNHETRWQRQTKVSANFALKKGELSKEKSEAIFEAVTKVLPK